MQPLLNIKPSRRNYLLSLTVFVLMLMTLTSLVGIFLYRDYLHGFPLTEGTVTGLLLGGLLLWVYDDRTRFERLTITLTENTIIVPGAFKEKTYLLAGLDKHRTLTYNSENNLRNRILYTFWLVDGDSMTITKTLYGRTQMNALLEKIGLPKI